MSGDKPGWGLKVRVWVERGGKKVLGPGRVELLGHIDRQRSISAAAKQMNMSYRRAWELVQAMNDAAGESARRGQRGRVGRRRRDRHRPRARASSFTATSSPGSPAAPTKSPSRKSLSPPNQPENRVGPLFPNGYSGATP